MTCHHQIVIIVTEEKIIKSNMKKCNDTEVPQGSITRPVLFKIFTSTILEILNYDNSSDITNYTDDTDLLICSSNDIDVLDKSKML